MKNFLIIGLFAAIMATFGTGCAAQAQCLRDNAELHARVDQQQQDLRDTNGKLAVVASEKTGGDLAQLAKDGWSAATGAFGWATNEAPIAAHQAETAYNDASARMNRARQCYRDHGGESAHTYDEYKAIATACLNGN